MTSTRIILLQLCSNLQQNDICLELKIKKVHCVRTSVSHSRETNLEKSNLLLSFCNSVWLPHIYQYDINQPNKKFKSYVICGQQYSIDPQHEF